MLKVENVSKKFFDQVALKNVSFQLNPGKVYGFLGPNGAGKTTAMRIITGYLLPDIGKISFKSTKIGDQRKSNNNWNIGYLPENNPIYENMRVDEFLLFVNGIKDADKKALKIIVEECGLSDVLNKEINELSKGYKQRVGLAKALIGDPDYLVLDEPSTGLDPNQKTEILELIQRLGKEKTVLFSSHILTEVESIVDELIIINKGEIVATGSARDISRKHLKGNVISIELESPMKGTLEKVSKIVGVESIEHVSKNKERFSKYEVLTKVPESVSVEIFKLAMKEKWILKELHTESNNLENLFKKLTTK